MRVGCYCDYGQAGLRLRRIVRLHKILHTLLPALDTSSSQVKEVVLGIRQDLLLRGMIPD